MIAYQWARLHLEQVHGLQCQITREAEALRIASCLLAAAMPERMGSLWSAWDLDIDPLRDDLVAKTAWGGFQEGTTIKKVALFPRIEREVPVD